mmetsp:Transcript_29651/g.67202  ORF Transcript_29651/g.67202 Transcript_29651/m.67202 type:complete len:243 (+) Transcript_29651:1437-2165(+)
MLGAALGLAHIAQLLLRLFLHVLEDIQDAAGVCFVNGSRRGAEIFVIGLGALPRLDQAEELLPVRARKRGGVDDCIEGVQKALEARRAHLREGRGVLGHLAPQDRDGPAKRVHDVEELCLVLREVRSLLLPDRGGVAQVLGARGDAGSKLLDPGARDRRIAGRLADGGLQLCLLGGRCLDLVILVPGCVIAPLDEVLVGLLLRLTLLLDLCCQGVHQLDHLAQGVGLRPRGLEGRRASSQDQ